MSETNPRWWWLFLPAAMPVFASNYTFDETLLLGSGYEKSLAMLNDPDAVVAGRYSVDIWLNGRYVGRDDVLFRQNTAGRTEPCLPAKFWDEQGVTAASEQAQDCFAPEARISGGRWDFDQSLLRLNLSVPQAALKRTPMDYVPPSQWQSGESVLFSNYNLHAYHNKNNGQQSDYGWLGLSSGFNMGSWQFRQQSSANWRRDGDRESQRWDALQTWLQHPVASLESLLTVGESYTSGNLLGSMAFTGVKLETDQRMVERFTKPAYHKALLYSMICRIQPGTVIYKLKSPAPITKRVAIPCHMPAYLYHCVPASGATVWWQVRPGITARPMVCLPISRWSAG